MKTLVHFEHLSPYRKKTKETYINLLVWLKAEREENEEYLASMRKLFFHQDNVGQITAKKIFQTLEHF